MLEEKLGLLLHRQLLVFSPVYLSTKPLAVYYWKVTTTAFGEESNLCSMHCMLLENDD